MTDEANRETPASANTGTPEQPTGESVVKKYLEPIRNSRYEKNPVNKDIAFLRQRLKIRKKQWTST